MHHSRNGFLTAKGLAEAEQRSLEGLAVCDVHPYVDKVGSVSALRRDETFLEFDDALIEEQYRRFLNGS